MASLDFFDTDMHNSTNTTVYFDGKDGNLYLRLRKIYSAKFEQTITHQHVLLRREMRIRINNIVVAHSNCTLYIY